MVNHPQRTGLPSHEAVLEGLRHIHYRQVVRHKHAALFDTLARMAFIAWVRQPLRVSQQPVSTRSQHIPLPVEVAELTDTGRAALDWLTRLEQLDEWIVRRTSPYDSQYASDAS
jgi:hypothetical protein